MIKILTDFQISLLICFVYKNLNHASKLANYLDKNTSCQRIILLSAKNLFLNALFPVFDRKIKTDWLWPIKWRNYKIKEKSYYHMNKIHGQHW